MLSSVDSSKGKIYICICLWIVFGSTLCNNSMQTQLLKLYKLIKPTGHTETEKAYKHFSKTAVCCFTGFWSARSMDETFWKKKKIKKPTHTAVVQTLMVKNFENVLIHFLALSSSSNTWINTFFIQPRQTLTEQAVVDSFISMPTLQSSKSLWEIKAIIIFLNPQLQPDHPSSHFYLLEG